MVKAVLRNGIFVPRDPLPEDWQEGTEVQVERPAKTAIPDNGVPPTDTWMDEVEAIASQGDPADDLRLETALQEIQTREKELARRKRGLDA